jgi:hypothetical protein
MRLAKIALGLCLAAAGAAQAGTVTVSFANPPARFSDAGESQFDEQHNLQALARHLETMGRTLPAQQSLQIELLDVDLAGEMRLLRLSPGRQLRIVRGGADVPRVMLRYTLESNGRVLSSAEEAIADLDYARRGTSVHADRSLYFEKRMLTRWFQNRFAAPAAAAR